MKMFLTQHIGGPDVDPATEKVLQAVSDGLATGAREVDPVDFEKINFRTRVSGRISKFLTPTGFNGSLLQPTKRTVLIDITIQRDVWSRGVDATREALVGAIVAGVLDADRKARSKGLELQTAAIIRMLRDKFGMIAQLPSDSEVEAPKRAAAKRSPKAKMTRRTS